MTNDAEDDAVDKPKGNGLYESVSLEDFAATDINAATAGMARVDRHFMCGALSDLEHQAEAGEDAVATRVYRLLKLLMGLHLRVDTEGDPFGLQWQSDARRTALPVDFAGDQAEVLAAAAARVSHPTLRARMADVAYETGVKRAGATAVTAYCEIVERLADGRAELEFPEIGTRAMDMVKPLDRAFMINARIAKKGSVMALLGETLCMAFKKALEERAFFPAARLGQRILQTKIMPPEDIEAVAERLASAAAPDDYNLAIKELWQLVAQARQLAGDTEGSRAASVKAIEQTLAMADTVFQNAAKASWVKDALREFRALGGCAERVEKLRRLLRELQDKALDEVSALEFPLEGIAEVRGETMTQFRGLDLPAALKAIIGFVIPDKVEEIKAHSLKNAKEFVLSTLFSSVYSDTEGREVARGQAFDESEPTESWFKEHGIRDREVVRRFRVHGNIEPARQAVLERFSVNEQHMLAIVAMSTFVPAGHRNIFSLGFARMWQGDYVTACHLLLPQVENSLRHVLTMSGRDTAKIMDDGIEGDRTLNILLSNYRGDLDTIFGVNMVWELDSLLNFRPGPALRNELAHGKMPWVAFFTDEAITACWLVYLLTLAPLLKRWDDFVVPALKETTPTVSM